MKYKIGFVLLRWSVKCKNSTCLIQRGLQLLGPFLFTSPLSFQMRPIWQLETEFSGEKTLTSMCCNEFATGKYFSCRKLQQFLAWGRDSIPSWSQSCLILLIKGPVIIVYSRITWDSGLSQKYYCDNFVHFTFLHSYFRAFIHWRMPKTPSVRAGTLMLPQGRLGLRSRGKLNRFWYFTLRWKI